MEIRDHLAAFDGWLTRRIDEAYAARKDLAFRDLATDARLGDNAWEYSLLEPGARAPHGDGWSVYRLQGVWPEFADQAKAPPPPDPVARKSLLSSLTQTFRGGDRRR